MPIEAIIVFFVVSISLIITFIADLISGDIIGILWLLGAVYTIFKCTVGNDVADKNK